MKTNPVQRKIVKKNMVLGQKVSGSKLGTRELNAPSWQKVAKT